MAMPKDPDEGKSLHDCAADAVQDLHRLQTGLAHAGATPQALKAIGAMVATLTPIVKALAASPQVEEAAKSGPAEPQPVELAQQSQGPPQPPMGRPGPFGQATQELHQAAQQRANQPR